MRAMWWHDIYIILGFLLFLHLVILKNVWFMILGFSCDGRCLSWIEFIFDLSMWASILVYIFELIMEAMIIMLHTFMLCYDTVYDDNACTLWDVYALLYNMMYMHTIVLWCSPMHYDVYLMLMMHTRCTLRWWWWCIFNDYDDAYPMTMTHTYDDDIWLCMPYVQWKQRRITCAIIMYDEAYNDVHEKCMALKWLVGIHG